MFVDALSGGGSGRVDAIANTRIVLDVRYNLAMVCSIQIVAHFPPATATGRCRYVQMVDDRRRRSDVDLFRCILYEQYPEMTIQSTEDSNLNYSQ